MWNFNGFPAITAVGASLVCEFGCEKPRSFDVYRKKIPAIRIDLPKLRDDYEEPRTFPRPQS